MRLDSMTPKSFDEKRSRLGPNNRACTILFSRERFGSEPEEEGGNSSAEYEESDDDEDFKSTTTGSFGSGDEGFMCGGG